MQRNEIINNIKNQYAQKILREQRRISKATSLMFLEYEDIKKIDEKKKKINVLTAKQALQKPNLSKEFAMERDIKVSEYNAQIDSLMEYYNIDKSTFIHEYDCYTCLDTGEIHSNNTIVFCKCFLREFIEQIYNLSTSPELRSENFENFNLDVFPDDILVQNGRSTQREYMAKVCNLFERYVESLPEPRKRNILLHGKPGLGKTYLLNCIAKGALDRGTSVVKLTAYKMMEILRRYHYNNDGMDEKLLLDTSEVLIIDDLGSEPMYENISIEYIFSIINERAINKLCTIIATNLEPEAIQKRYSERVSSRLLDNNSMLIKLEGEDIRMYLRTIDTGR